MQLPQQKSKITMKFQDQKFLMLGDAGIGKTEFWAQSPSALFMEAEAGLNFIEAYKVPCRNWLDVAEFVGLLLKEKEKLEKGQIKEFPYEVVVIDTIDRVVDYGADYIIEKMRQAFPRRDIQGLGDHPQRGVGWFSHRNLIKKLLDKLETLPCAVAIISHLETKKIEEDGGEYDKATISIGGKVGSDILAWSDHTLHVKGMRIGDRIKRTVYTLPIKSREAKSRGGVIKNGWVWSEDKAENYKQLRSLFE